MNLLEFIAARLAEEDDPDTLLRQEFPSAYADPGHYRDAPWTYAGRDRLTRFARRWQDHPDYHPIRHGLPVPPAPAAAAPLATYRADITEAERAAAERIKEFEAQAGALMAELAELPHVDLALLERAVTDAVSACMFATRAVLRPVTPLAWPPGSG